MQTSFVPGSARCSAPKPAVVRVSSAGCTRPRCNTGARRPHAHAACAAASPPAAAAPEGTQHEQQAQQRPDQRQQPAAAPQQPQQPGSARRAHPEPDMRVAHEAIAASDAPLPDALRAALPGLFPTMTAARKAARRGRVRVAGARGACGTRVAAGQLLQVLEPADAGAGADPQPRRPRVRPPPPGIEIPIIYDDDFITVAVKPWGIKAHGSGWGSHHLAGYVQALAQPSSQGAGEGGARVLAWVRACVRACARARGRRRRRGGCRRGGPAGAGLRSSARRRPRPAQLEPCRADARPSSQRTRCRAGRTRRTALTS